MTKAMWICISFIFFIILVQLFWINRSQTNKMAEIEQRIIEVSDESNKAVGITDRVELRSDGNAQHIDSTHKLLNQFLVGNIDFSLQSEADLDKYNKLYSFEGYNNTDFSYYSKIDSIDTEFKVLHDDIQSLRDELNRVEKDLSEDIDDLDEMLSDIERKVKKIDRSVKKLDKDLKENALGFIDPRWKDLNIDQIYKEFKNSK